VRAINLHKKVKLLGLFGLSILGFFSPIDVQILSKKHTMTEICDNGTDDDADGLIDLNDPDCTCEVIIPESLIPNPSFEDMNCCPSNRSQLDCADVWIQASAPTTDYLHTCGWLGWSEFPPPLPFPDGDAVMGFRDGRVIGNGNGAETNWKEYAGACLLSPLLAGVPYRFEFYVGFVDPGSSPGLNITFFGSNDCDNLPFGGGDEAFGCPTNGPNWTTLGAKQVVANDWIKTTIDILPIQDIYAIVIGPPCEATSVPRSTYYFFDNLVLADLRSFEFVITEVNHPCSFDFTMEVPLEEGIEYQWYKEGVALQNETNPLLSQNYGEGIYQVRFIQDGSCLLTEAFEFKIPETFDEVSVTLCKDEILFFGDQVLDESGDYLDTLRSVNNCDSVVNLTLEILGQQADSLSAKIFEGESYQGVDQNTFSNAGQYTAVLESSLGCDSLVFLDLQYYQVYAPNIFSPNGDGINDYFTLSGSNELIEINSLLIIDRWGNIVFEGSNIIGNDLNGWDGVVNGSYVESGVYAFIAMIEMDDGIVRQIKGSVKLMY